MLRPSLSTSACNCAWMTYGSTTAYMFCASISTMAFMRRMSSCTVGSSSLTAALNSVPAGPMRLHLEAVLVGQTDDRLDLFGGGRQGDGCMPGHEVTVLRPDQLRKVLERVVIQDRGVTRDVLGADDVLERAVGVVGELGRLGRRRGRRGGLGVARAHEASFARPAERATSSSTSWTARSAPGPPDAESAATASLKLSSQREQAVTSACGAGRRGLLHALGGGRRRVGGEGLAAGAAGAAAPGGLAGALHLEELDAGDRGEQVARRLVDAVRAVVARPRRVVDHRLAVDLLLDALPGHVGLALAAEVAGVVVGDRQGHGGGQLEAPLLDQAVGELDRVQHLGHAPRRPRGRGRGG